MTNDVNNHAANHELSIDDLDTVDGGFWVEFARAVLVGAYVGGRGGAPDAVGGAVVGGIGYFVSAVTR